MIPISQLVRDMFANRTRLLLTILAVAWGTFSITSMLAVGEGLRLTFGNAIANSGEGSLVVTGKQTTKAHHGQSNGIKILLTQHDLDTLKKSFAGRALITGSIAWDVHIHRNAKESRGPPVTAVEPDYVRMHAIHVMPGGRFIDAEDNKQHRQVIVLGDHTVKKLFNANENPIGQYVYLKNKPFLVIGIQNKTVQLIETSQYPDEMTNWIPYSIYQELSNNYNYSNFIIAPQDLTIIPRLQNEVRRYIASSRQVDPNDPGLVDFINIQEEKQKINLFFYGIEIVLGIIGSLTLLVAGVGIANVMYISVRRATREIGIRMALGATAHDILAYYACEAGITTAIGGVIGLFLTKIVVFIINCIPINSDILEEFGSPRPVMSLSVILLVIFTLGATGLLAGIFPARKAALINPAEALRYE